MYDKSLVFPSTTSDVKTRDSKRRGADTILLLRCGGTVVPTGTRIFTTYGVCPSSKVSESHQEVIRNGRLCFVWTESIPDEEIASKVLLLLSRLNRSLIVHYTCSLFRSTNIR